MLPQIIASYDCGRNQSNMDASIARLELEGGHRDLSCLLLIPALGTVPTRAVAAWWDLYFPPNQKLSRLFAVGLEPGAAYSDAIIMALDNPWLSKYKYLLTMEHDNLPPPDGAVKLIQRMEQHPEFAAIGGLYFTRGEGGNAQIYGDPRNEPYDFRSQLPVPGQLVECCAVAMGFTVFRMDLFKDRRLRRPWFKMGDSPADAFSTQDFYAWSDFRKYGYRCAVDCAVAVGHLDLDTGIVW